MPKHPKDVPRVSAITKTAHAVTWAFFLAWPGLFVGWTIASIVSGTLWFCGLPLLYALTLMVTSPLMIWLLVAMILYILLWRSEKTAR